MSCTHSTGGCGCSHDHEVTSAPNSALEAPVAEHGCCGGSRADRPTVDVGSQRER